MTVHHPSSSPAAGGSLRLDQSFQSSCGEVRFGATGEGRDVVLVHGTPTSSYIWTEVVEQLSDRFRFHYLDLPGYGESEKFGGQEVRLRSFARVVAEWIDTIELARPILVGHDFGAAAVLGAHLIEGVDVTALCIVDGVVLSPWGTPFSRHVQQHEEVFAAVPEYVHRAVIRAHLETAMHRSPRDASVMAALIDPWCGPEGQSAYYRQVGQYDHEYTEMLESRYPSIDVPTVVMWGLEDRWVSIDEGRRFTELLPNGRIRTLPDAGHFSMLDSPGLFSEYLDDWIRSLPPPWYVGLSVGGQDP